MKIGIDHQASRWQKSGLGVYTHHLVESLVRLFGKSHQFYLYSREVRSDWNTLRRLYWENVELPQMAKRDRVELLHVPAFSPPLVRSQRLVMTVHDLIGMLFPNQIGLPSRFYWGTWLPRIAQRADHIIANSISAKTDLMKHLSVPEKKITVIYPSGHEGFEGRLNGTLLASLKSRLGIREKYFLSVGTIEPRKNLSRVIEAFRQFLKQKRDLHYQLVIVGSKDFAGGRVFKSLFQDSSPHPEDVLFTGFLEKQDLNLLYGGTQAFLFPSLYEGFGIPILEAMASGTAVLTSRTSSLPEAAGDAAYYVDPYRTEEILKGMEDLAGDERLRQEFIQRGFRQVTKFSWDQTARETVKVYEACA